MKRLLILLALVLSIGAVLPALAQAAPLASRQYDTSIPLAEYWRPWKGSYLRLVPKTLTTTSSRTVTVKFMSYHNTWADGGRNWSLCETIVPKPGRFTGNITGATWTDLDTLGLSDPNHSDCTVGKCWGSAKVRLTAGNGRKVIKLRFTTWQFGADPSNPNYFAPNFPTSPTYQVTVKLSQ